MGIRQDLKFNDYRDYYPLACLVFSGYVSCGINELDDEFTLASIFYAQATGAKKVNNFNNTSGSSGLKRQTFTTTAKAELYFDELKAKRTDKFFTALISILVGVSSAVITLTIKSNI